MKIKEVELLTGITKSNIRYYESQGLLLPNRESNGYRTYDENHIRQLLRIKLFRTLGIPIESIKALHDQNITLQEALDARKAQFQGEHQELVISEEIIGIILDANTDFHEINPETYLLLFDQPEESPIQHDINTKPMHPIRRLCSRTLDFTIYNLLLYLTAPILFQNKDLYFILIIAEVLVLILIEPLLLCTIYTTPGKLIFGMTVTNLEGNRLTYHEALTRTLLVLQHGLGFCAPFLKEYMQMNSYTITQSNGELIWEQNSELNIKDSKPSRFILFALLFAVCMIYPAKMEYARIFLNSEAEAKYQGETPFLSDYAVDKILYSATNEEEPLPLIRLTADELWFSYDGNTKNPFTLIGSFKYAPPGQDPTAGVWELQTDSVSNGLYKLRVDEKGDVILDHYVNLDLHSSWKLIDLDILQVEYQNNLTRTYVVPEWFEYGDYDGNIDLLKPSRFGSEFTVTIIFNCDMPDTIVIKEEIHRTEDVQINRLILNKDEKGLYCFKFKKADDAVNYVIYRMAHANGELMFCILC